jgi:hypothetical protein
MALSNRPSSLARPDLIITEYRFLSHSMEKGIRKLSKSLIAIQRSDRMLSPFRTVTQARRDQTASSASIDSSSTPWKWASGNSSKSLIAIQRSDRKLWLPNCVFCSETLVRCRIVCCAAKLWFAADTVSVAAN